MSQIALGFGFWIAAVRLGGGFLILERGEELEAVCRSRPNLSAFMKPSSHVMPVFALEETSEWGDLDNSLEASVGYQSRAKGEFFPLFLFAPRCEPANPDSWEPMKVLPEDLLIVSIARKWDALVLKTLRHAAPVVGEV